MPQNCTFIAFELQTMMINHFMARPRGSLVNQPSLQFRGQTHDVLKATSSDTPWLGELQPSAAAFEGVPLAWPWYLPRPHKLFLLGFETAMWHVLARPQKPQNLRSSFRRPWNLTTPRSSFRRRAACLAMVPP